MRVYPAANASDGVVVTWNTDQLVASQVEYGLDGELDQTATGESFYSSPELGHVHEVVLSGLKPASCYQSLLVIWLFCRRRKRTVCRI
jgi:hypothetical protein